MHLCYGFVRIFLPVELSEQIHLHSFHVFPPINTTLVYKEESPHLSIIPLLRLLQNPLTIDS